MERDIVLATPRLVLTSWVPEDVDDLLDVHSDPQTMLFVRHGRPESRAETEQLIATYIDEYGARGWSKWRIVDHEGTLIGRAGFGGQPARRHLAFLIRRSHWGRGLATEIAGSLVAWHASHAPDVPLRAIAVIGNHASVRVLEKVGFADVGTEDFDGIACRSFVHPDTG